MEKNEGSYYPNLCCISYLLMHNKLQKNLTIKTENINYVGYLHIWNPDVA